LSPALTRIFGDSNLAEKTMPETIPGKGDDASQPGKAPWSRNVMTLVEMVIVVGVIAILCVCLILAVRPAKGYGTVAEASMEIRILEHAISQFKMIYGMEPPSRIRLYEAGVGPHSWSSHAGSFEEPVTKATVTHDSERLRSREWIQRIWPDFDFKLARDLVGDGDTTDVIELNGAECLVFFLAGIVENGGKQYKLTGFSKSATDPFAPASETENTSANGPNSESEKAATNELEAGPEEQSAARIGPFFEFELSRLRPSVNPLAMGALVYIDPLGDHTAPYVYVSSYAGKGYERPDLFTMSQNYLKDVYVLPADPAAESEPPKAQKSPSFQIISPGLDRMYGSGGLFDPTIENNGLSDRRDDDNLTNFSTGILNLKAM